MVFGILCKPLASLLINRLRMMVKHENDFNRKSVFVRGSEVKAVGGVRSRLRFSNGSGQLTNVDETTGTELRTCGKVAGHV